VIGLAGVAPCSEIQTTTGPFLPASAGPWKCAIVAGPDNPLYVTDQVSTRDAGSYVRLAVPVPEVVTGGTCWAPFNATLNDIGAASAAVIDPTKPSGARASKVRRETLVCIVLSSQVKPLPQ
jgi:hypothetical protein